MSVDHQQHNDITEELQKNFENHSFISIIATKANGNEEFQVTYKVNGLVEGADGEISVEENHTILLSIPFGFPLFAPNCKPITSTFHPDFDPGAICLGSFWNQDRTCTELIEFISRMIIGEVYSQENAFNEKAAHWYNTNSTDFPLSTNHNSTAHKEIVEKPSKEDESLSGDFNFLSLESSDPLEEELTEPLTREYDLEKLQEYIERKAFYQLDRELNNIPISANFTQRDEFRELIDTAFAKAQKFQKMGSKFEVAGEFAEAQKAYAKALATVSDFYGAQEALERVEQAILVGSKPKKKKKTPVEEESAEEGDKEVVKKARKPVNITQYIPLLAGGAVLIGLALSIASVFESYQFTQSIEQTYKSCESSFAKKEFRAAKAMCESVQNRENDGGLFFGKKISRLQNQAKTLLASDDFIHGLAGKIKINGIWVDQNSLNNISPFQMLLGKIEQIIKEEKWTEASKVLRQATALAQSDAEKDELGNMRGIITFKKAQQKALVVYNQKGCSAAEPYLFNAQKIAQELSPELQQLYLPEVRSYLTECAFYELIAEGNKLYESSDWESALPVYQDALAKIQGYSLSDTSSVNDIQDKINKSALYSTMDEANKAFSQNRWQKAIRTYRKAIELIDKDPDANAQITTLKIKSIILQAQIVEAQLLGRQYYETKNFSDAIKQQRKIAQYIEQSLFAKEANYISMIKEIPQEIKRLETKEFIENKRQELLKKQMDLFIENYPAASPKTLVDQEILFVSDVNNLITYKMKATDVSKGRPLTLVIFYAYNKTTRAWEFAKTPVVNN